MELFLQKLRMAESRELLLHNALSYMFYKVLNTLLSLIFHKKILSFERSLLEVVFYVLGIRKISLLDFLKCKSLYRKVNQKQFLIHLLVISFLGIYIYIFL